MYNGNNFYGYGDDELMHYGVLGMKWGVRRYVNRDGTLTATGKKRVQSMSGKTADLSPMNKKERNKYAKTRVKVAGSKYAARKSETKNFASDRAKGALKGLASIAGGTGGMAAIGYLGSPGAMALTRKIITTSAAVSGFGAMSMVASVAFAGTTMVRGSRYVKNMLSINKQKNTEDDKKIEQAKRTLKEQKSKPIK